jgi:polyphosphate kinase
MKRFSYFNRDLSWLSFNERVLAEAASSKVPLMEKIRFLSIFSSNLDEFYRVRMPVLKVIDKDKDLGSIDFAYREAKQRINLQQQRFGETLKNTIIPALEANNVVWLYHQPIPDTIAAAVRATFKNSIESHIKAVNIDIENKLFFAENNKLYLGVILKNQQENEQLVILNIPSDILPRLYAIADGNKTYVLFLDDIIRFNINTLFPDDLFVAAYSLKVTRDAELHLEEEIDENIIAAMEKELAKRDFGIATRFLCQPDIPLRHLYKMIYALNLEHAAIVLGGYYHNLKDLSSFPLQDFDASYPAWPALPALAIPQAKSIFDKILEKDVLVNLPYQSFDTIINFFEAAAEDASVTEVYCTLYRVAKNSKVVTALINAANNNKKVVVMLELKARFDEENNIKWAAKLKASGVQLIYSSVKYKVHAKVALVKRRINQEHQYFGLLSTGNLNETTAKFYTDHAILTARLPILKELEMLFNFLALPKKSLALKSELIFKELLVAQFNLQHTFLSLIDREIEHSRKGRPATIIIKLNNLEEKVLINKLYEASNAGVQIKLIIRGICCLIPGIPSQSENISIHRIVDRYLEHGRLFLFENNGASVLYMGSADWMNRNIYSRIEVCFPVYDAEIKKTLIDILSIQLQDTRQAVALNASLENVPFNNSTGLRSQEEIYQLLKTGLSIKELI